MSEWMKTTRELGMVPSYQRNKQATSVRVVRPSRPEGPAFAVELGFGPELAVGYNPSEARAIAKLLVLGAEEAERAEEKLQELERLERVAREAVERELERR